MGNEQNLLVGLEELDENVSIENIDRYFQQQGVIVHVHVGRIRGSFELTPKTLGVNLASDEVKGFFKDHVRNGSMSFLPMTVEKKFHRIENRIRQLRVRMSIGYDNSFMPIETYKQFKTRVEEAREEYFELRDQVLLEWYDLKNKFMVNLNTALSEMNTSDKEKIYQAISKWYPSKTAYHDSFYMETSLKAFPVMANLSLLDERLSDEVRESSVKDNLKMIHEVLGIAFNQAFEVANIVYRSYAVNRKLPSKTKGSISRAIKEIKSKNLLKHPSVEELVEDLDALYQSTEVDEATEIAEIIMAKSYGNCSELDLMSYLDLSNSELSQMDLEVLAQSYVSHIA